MRYEPLTNGATGTNNCPFCKVDGQTDLTCSNRRQVISEVGWHTFDTN